MLYTMAVDVTTLVYVHLSVSPCVCPSFCQPFCMPIFLSALLYVHLSVSPFVCPSFCQPFCPYIFLSVLLFRLSFCHFLVLLLCPSLYVVTVHTIVNGMSIVGEGQCSFYTVVNGERGTYLIYRKHDLSIPLGEWNYLLLYSSILRTVSLSPLK